ncbi:MAG TPA: aminoglycoside phosphotransferase family protein [Dehalococcoidia bacterium]|nr:aminoglycoside phosphotransferase family protein [Dehalococcoidia bacterium]
MAEAPKITNDEILAGWRLPHTPASEVRILKRKRNRPPAGLTGSYFERVRLKAGDRTFDAILKLGDLLYGPPTRERLFFAELAGQVPLRTPRCYAVGPALEGRDSWVLMERIGRGKWMTEWTPDDTRGALRRLAALHARFLGDPPAAVSRPFTRDLDHTLSFVPEGVRSMRARFDELPYLPRIASERALDLLVALAANPDAYRAALAQSPETLLHGDYHRGNMAVADGEEPVHFDWQFVCGGPPAYDLAIFWLYLGAVNKRGLFFDRAEVWPRSMTWDEVLGVYTSALRALRPDADIDAIAAASDAAIMFEAIRQITYFGHGVESQIGLLRFIYRDHRTIGGRIARWFGIDQGWTLFEDMYAEFERRAPRFLPASSPPRMEDSARAG